ncbi:hypothetical protein [Kordia sp.]|uniref:hypothetical protein n=1 Tax=Kordia sp. TaxID=1965332 RepID=UPI003B5AF3BD
MKDEVIISQGDRSLWHNIVAAFFYAVTIMCILLLFFGFELSFEKAIVENKVQFIEIAIFSGATAFYYSVVQTYYFDFKNNRYKYERAVLFVKLGRWKTLPALEYISVFNKKGMYQVNLWYAGNKHFNIYSMLDEAAALEVGKKLAISLRIDLLDATVANDSKWIDL